MKTKLNDKEACEGKEAFQRFRAFASALVQVPKSEIEAQAKKNARKSKRKT